MLDSARLAFVKARANAVDAARAALCDFYTALCWLALEHKNDTQASLERCVESMRRGLWAGLSAWNWAKSRGKREGFKTWHYWRDTMWPKPEAEVERIRGSLSAQMNGLCELSRGVSVLRHNLGDQAGPRFRMFRVNGSDALCVIAGEYEAGETARLGALELHVKRFRRATAAPSPAVIVDLEVTNLEDERNALSTICVLEEWEEPESDWPVIPACDRHAITDPSIVREMRVRPLSYEDDDDTGILWLDPLGSARGSILIPVAPPAAVMYVRDWFEMAVFRLPASL